MEQAGVTQLNRSAFAKPIIIGYVFAFILIAVMVFTVNTPRPEWGKYWMVQPLIVTPLMGAMGGLFFSLVNFFGSKRGLNKIVTVPVGLVGSIIALWLGIVLGLHGTMWN